MVGSRLVRVGPDLTVSDNVPFQAGKGRDDFTEPCCWYSDFEVIVFSGGITGEQLQRPTGRDIPRGADRRHALRDFTGCLRFPELVDLGARKRPPCCAHESGSGLANARRWTRKRSTPGYFSPREVTTKLFAA